MSPSLRWHHANRERSLRRMRSHSLMSRYGITLDQFDALLAGQGNKCAICLEVVFVHSGTGCTDKHNVACVDHDHKTGKVRGILCGDCNRALGMFNDDIQLLGAAQAYLESHHDTH